MAPVSKRQARLFRAIAAGRVRKRRTGLSKAVAAEMVKGHPIKGLPERKRKRRRR